MTEKTQNTVTCYTLSGLKSHYDNMEKSKLESMIELGNMAIELSKANGSLGKVAERSGVPKSTITAAARITEFCSNLGRVPKCTWKALNQSMSTIKKLDPAEQEQAVNLLETGYDNKELKNFYFPEDKVEDTEVTKKPGKIDERRLKDFVTKCIELGQIEQLMHELYSQVNHAELWNLSYNAQNAVSKAKNQRIKFTPVK